MNLCDAKQKAFAQRVYFDLRICRKWSKLRVFFDHINKWIFFVGTPSDDQPLTFVLPISNDEELVVDDLFNLTSKLSFALPSDIDKNISSVMMAIIANDFTLGYFNVSLGLPSTNIVPPVENRTSQIISTDDNDLRDETKRDTINSEWSTNEADVTWD